MRLYNLTDEAPLVESEVSNFGGLTLSDNILDVIPKKEVKLALHLRSEVQGVTLALLYNSVLEISPE